MEPKTRKEVRGAILGMVMGDASLYRNKLRNGDPCGHYKLDIGHCQAQLPYLIYKRNLVQNLFDYPLAIKPREIKNRRTGKTYKAYKFATRTHPRLSFIAKRVYLNDRKRITPWVLDNLTDEGLAYWWMDDGCLNRTKTTNRKPGGKVYRYDRLQAVWGTYGYPREDSELLRDWLEAHYKVQFKVYKHCKSGWYLRTMAGQVIAFLSLLAKHCVPAMAYKFPDWETAPAPSCGG